MKHIFQLPTLLISLSLLFYGCDGGGKKEEKTKEELNNSSVMLTPCEQNISQTLNASALNVMQNSVDTGSKLINDSYTMVKRMDQMNERVLKTTELSSKTFAKLGADITMTSEGESLFKVENYSPYFTIKRPLTKKYLLASSPNRFFPDQQTVKTLFYNAPSLTKALDRAINTADKENNLYITILQLETNGTLTNLTNGLLIPKSNL